MNVVDAEMKAQATQHLDELNDLRRLAVAKHYETIGKIGEEKTFADAMEFSNKYQEALEAYAKLGFRNLGIHNVK
jgi:hypothetical protein